MSKILKILLFEGGAKLPVFIDRLAVGLAEHGHMIYISHFDERKRSSHKNLQYISLGNNKNKLDLIRQSLSLASEDNLRSVVETFRLIATGNRKSLQRRNFEYVLKKIKPDLIHIQWPDLLDFMEEVPFKLKIPVVLSLRGFQINVRPFTNPDHRRKLKQYFFKLSGFHSVSRAMSAKGDLIYHNSEKIDEIVYSGIDFSDFRFNLNYRKGEKLTIISIGRPHWIKSYDDAIQACYLLKQKGIDFEYTIVGAEGNEELLFLIHKLKLVSDVKTLKKIKHTAVLEMLRSSNVLLVSSVAEGLPNVVVEAMALGTPVLTTACGGVEELIKHDIEGWITPVRDPQGIARQLERFNFLPVSKIEEVRKAARRKVEKQHSKKQMVEGMEQLYKRVLEKH